MTMNNNLYLYIFFIKGFIFIINIISKFKNKTLTFIFNFENFSK